MSKCERCGEPMPAGETMFKYHGYSGPCPKPPLHAPRPEGHAIATARATEERVARVICAVTHNPNKQLPDGRRAWERYLPEARLVLEALRDPTCVMTEAARDVLAERRRQVETEGWTPAHDDEHAGGEMAAAAACYAMWPEAAKKLPNWVPPEWPWTDEWWKPGTPRRNYVKAAALLLAEIERLDRAAPSAEGGEHGN